MTEDVPRYEVSDTLTICVTGTTAMARREYRAARYDRGQNFPNPFNGGRSIPISLPHAGGVRIELIDALGVIVRTLLDDVRTPGPHVIHADLSDLSSGFYWSRLSAERKVHVKRLLVLR